MLTLGKKQAYPMYFNLKCCTLLMKWLIHKKMFSYFYNKFSSVNCMHYIKCGVNNLLLT